MLIDSVDVNDSDFGYTDMGRFQDRPLEMNKTYYYKVLTTIPAEEAYRPMAEGECPLVTN